MKKNTKSTVIMVLGFALAGVVLAGCGEKRQDTQQEISISTSKEAGHGPEAEKADTETTKKAEEGTNEKAVQVPEVYEDNFAVSSKAAKEFAEKVKVAAANKDLEALAGLTAFPVYVGLPDAGVVETREDFLKFGAETVFTEALLKSIENADIENFQPSMAGFSISDGGTANINFGVVDGELAVNGINY